MRYSMSGTSAVVVLGVNIGTTPTLDTIAQQPGLAVALSPADALAIYHRVIGVLLALLPLLRAPASPGADDLAGDERLLTASEVAERLGVPKGYVYELIRRGELPSVQVGAKYRRVRPAALRQWLAEREGKLLSPGPARPYSWNYGWQGAPAPPRGTQGDTGRVRRQTRRSREHRRQDGEGRDADSGTRRAPRPLAGGPRPAPAPDDASDETRW